MSLCMRRQLKKRCGLDAPSSMLPQASTRADPLVRNKNSGVANPTNGMHGACRRNSFAACSFAGQKRFD